MVWFWRLGRSVDSHLEGRQGVVSGRGELASLLDSRKCRLAGGSGAGGRGAGGGAVSAIRAASGASRVACPHCRGWHADRGPVRGAAVSTGGFQVTAVNLPLDRRPVVVAIAGSKGAGRTTFYRRYLRAAGLRLVSSLAICLMTRMLPRGWPILRGAN